MFENYASLQSGGWIIPLVLTISSLTGFYYLSRQLKSGTFYNDSLGKKHYSSKKPPLLNCWGFWVGLGCLFADIIVLLVMLNDK